MKKNILLFALIAFVSTLTFAQISTIKQRMLDRLPQINALKDKGIIGENNKGLLEFRTSDHSQAKLIKKENEDRIAVYKYIAKKTGTTPEIVAKARAEKIAEKAPKGHWLQDKSGKWYKK
jgi:uncharacterized protein YdbL (DUF1318 family)